MGVDGLILRFLCHRHRSLKRPRRRPSCTRPRRGLAAFRTAARSRCVVWQNWGRSWVYWKVSSLSLSVRLSAFPPSPTFLVDNSWRLRTRCVS